MNPSDWLTLQIVGGAIMSTGFIVWGFSWWLARQFTLTRALIYDKIEVLEKNIVSKLEYHEHHDDSRFAEVRNEIWDIKVRNAARDGLSPLQRKS